MSLNKKQVDSFFERCGYEVEDRETGRKTMDALRSRFTKIVRQIKNEGIDYRATDEIHVITIVMCEEIQLRAMTEIAIGGVNSYVDKDKKLKQKNHAISTFYQMSKMINDTSKKLGLSALDRKELEIEKGKEDELPDD